MESSQSSAWHGIEAEIKENNRNGRVPVNQLEKGLPANVIGVHSEFRF